MVIGVIARKTGFFFDGAVGINPMDNQIIHENLLHILNPYDECALNMALGVKEAYPGIRVLVVTRNGEDAEYLLDKTLSLGADEGVVLDLGYFINALTPAEKAQRWAKALKGIEWDLMMAGIKEIDTHEDELGVYLGAYLNIPVISGIKNLALENDSMGQVRATRKLEKGHGEVVTFQTPAVLTVEMTSEARYPTLRKISEPKKKRLMPSPQDLCIGEKVKNIEVEKLVPPKIRPKKGLVEVDGKLSVSDKLGQLFSGGVTEKKAENKLKGTPSEVAKALSTHLAERGFV